MSDPNDLLVEMPLEGDEGLQLLNEAINAWKWSKKMELLDERESSSLPNVDAVDESGGSENIRVSLVQRLQFFELWICSNASTFLLLSLFSCAEAIVFLHFWDNRRTAKRGSIPLQNDDWYFQTVWLPLVYGDKNAILLAMAFIPATMCRGFSTWVKVNKPKVGCYIPLNSLSTIHAYVGTLLLVLVLAAGIFFPVGVGIMCAKQKEGKQMSMDYCATLYDQAMITGYIINGVIILICVPAFKRVRKRIEYEAMYIMHHLFIAFYVLTIIHIYATWVWLPWVLGFYAFDRLLMYLLKKRTIVARFSTAEKTTILDVVPPKGFVYCTGQYVQLNIPGVSRWEWHPFSIATSPLQHHIRLYIDCVGRVGSWTRRCKDYFQSMVSQQSFLDPNCTGNAVILMGPYSGSFQNSITRKNMIYIARETGIVPFLSMLNHIIRCRDIVLVPEHLSSISVNLGKLATTPTKQQDPKEHHGNISVDMESFSFLFQLHKLISWKAKVLGSWTRALLHLAFLGGNIMDFFALLMSLSAINGSIETVRQQSPYIIAGISITAVANFLFNLQMFVYWRSRKGMGELLASPLMSNFGTIMLGASGWLLIAYRLKDGPANLEGIVLWISITIQLSRICWGLAHNALFVENVISRTRKGDRKLIFVNPLSILWSLRSLSTLASAGRDIQKVLVAIESRLGPDAVDLRIQITSKDKDHLIQLLEDGSIPKYLQHYIYYGRTDNVKWTKEAIKNKLRNTGEPVHVLYCGAEDGVYEEIKKVVADTAVETSVPLYFQEESVFSV